MKDKEKLQWHYQLQRTPIAIIGISALFPKAKNLREYWCNILSKMDCVTDVPESSWNVDDYYDADPKAPDKTYSRRGGFLPAVEFNPLEFGLPPDSLEAIDSAQLLSLIAARDALENAGYGDRDFDREKTGVVLGASGLWKAITPLTSRLQYPIWKKVLKSSGLNDEDVERIVEKMKLAYAPWQENSFPGMLTNVVAGRITNRFDLGGTNCTVDAACASSLSALKMAVGELIERRCDLMITGGVDTDNSILNYMCFSKTPAFSKRDSPNPFGASSDGMMVGEGIGMMVLKRLEDAERDGDRIYAVIKGIGTSSDGRYKSIYAPRPEGQMLSLQRAYEDAGFSPATVGLIEAHGTGTPRGDHCEFSALKQVFGKDNPRKQHIALGSVKSQIGHTKAAAGAASLIKTAMALYHKILPPTIGVSQPNPKFEIETSPFYINTEVKPWLQEGASLRRAGISSFGFGGTNYHVVLEEYEPVHRSAYRLHSSPQAILLWERDLSTLTAKCKQVLDQLNSEESESAYHSLITAYKTANVPTASARIGMVVNSPDELKSLLEISLKLLTRENQPDTWEHPKGIYYRRYGKVLNGRVVALFPGQGSQYLDMGRRLAVNFPPVHSAYKQVDDLFAADEQPPLSQTVFPQPGFESTAEMAAAKLRQEEQALRSTRYAQPAIGALSVGMYRILQQAGLTAQFTAGHSFGEITALWAAQVLSDADYFKLIKARGEAMDTPQQSSSPCDTGAMLSVQGEVSEVENVIKNLSHAIVANYNAPDQVVLSGSNPEISAAEKIFSNRGYNVTRLDVSAAFHSPFIQHASKPFAEAIDTVTFKAPTTAVFSNLTGEEYPSDPEKIKAILKEHLLQPVHFSQEIENIYERGGDCFIEIGPRRILTGLVESILGDRPHLAIALNPSRQKDSELQLKQAVVQLQVAGLELKDIDPYQIDPLPPKKPANPRLSIQLSGNNYVSSKTQQAFAEALMDGHQVRLPKPHQPSPTTPILETIPPDMSTPEALTPNSSTPKTMAHSDAQANNTPTALENLLTQFCAHQAEVSRIHERYLKDQADSAHAFLQVVQQAQQSDRPSQSPSLPQPPTEPPLSSPTLITSAEQSPTAPNTQPDFQFEPTEVVNPTADIIQFSAPTTSAPVAPAPAAIPTETPVTAEPPVPTKTPDTTAAEIDADVLENISTVLLASVSAKTGYPAEMLELDMDLEADLGVDSIKRVEIMGHVQNTLTDLPRLSTEELGELRTLKEIVDYVAGQLGKKKSAELAPVQ